LEMPVDVCVRPLSEGVIDKTREKKGVNGGQRNSGETKASKGNGEKTIGKRKEI